jgi:hypothetical protein
LIDEDLGRACTYNPQGNNPAEKLSRHITRREHSRLSCLGDQFIMLTPRDPI